MLSQNLYLNLVSSASAYSSTNLTAAGNYTTSLSYNIMQNSSVVGSMMVGIFPYWTPKTSPYIEASPFNAANFGNPNAVMAIRIAAIVDLLNGVYYKNSNFLMQNYTRNFGVYAYSTNNYSAGEPVYFSHDNYASLYYQQTSLPNNAINAITGSYTFYNTGFNGGYLFLRQPTAFFYNLILNNSIYTSGATGSTNLSTLNSPVGADGTSGTYNDFNTVIIATPLSVPYYVSSIPNGTTIRYLCNSNNYSKLC